MISGIAVSNLTYDISAASGMQCGTVRRPGHMMILLIMTVSALNSKAGVHVASRSRALEHIRGPDYGFDRAANRVLHAYLAG